MYLHRLEIAGFKSFGSRVRLDCRPGISAVVGPNGSGKSNIAEAINWVLGAQNVRDLRARKTEELIYQGSDGSGKAHRAKASMAEVIMTLKGRVGDTELGLDELVISRRLYRSGESEYRLAGQKILLKDLQRILAQAGFGAASYTVIGQGMIESLIIASPSQRKLLFEEASGIRAFELQRIEDTRKLERAREKATELRNEITILSPEQVNLQKQVGLLNRQRELSQGLKQARTDWITQEVDRITAQIQMQTVELSELGQRQIESKTQLTELELQAKQYVKTEAQSNRQQTKLLAELNSMDQKNRRLTEKIAGLQAELQLIESDDAANQKPARLTKELKLDQAKLTNLRSYLVELAAKNQPIEDKIAGFNAKIAALNSELNSLRRQLTANQRNEYLKQALSLARLLATQFNRPKKMTDQEFGLAIHKLIRMVKLASEADLSALPARIARLQQGIARELAKREDVIETQTSEIIKQRSIELDINALEKNIEITQAQLAKLPPSQTSQINTQKNLLKRLIIERDDLDKQAQTKRQELSKQATSQTTAEQVELAHAIESVRQNYQQSSQQINRHQDELRELTRQLKDYHRQAENWGVKPQKTKPKSTIQASDLTRLEAELQLIGEIDEALIGAHSELGERLEFLERQAHDMEQAANDLETVLGELERRIRQTFATNFAKMNDGFASHFKELFGGGTAALKLVPEDNGGFGIEITARPPGKRVEHLSSLSGGEKAMSAIALLAAILDVNPSPFIVLDEVDAALDDANSKIFTDLLHNLSKKSQLIVITHNHETMLQADELFGITSSPRTSSTIVAVDLRQAERLVVS